MVYQIQDKFRNEARAKSGLLRGREFSMKDLYSFHVNEEDLNQYYEQVKEAYFRIYQRLGIGKETYLTYASGGTFSKYSHEFQTLCEAGEDIIYICDKCHVAINKEIIDDQNSCPVCGNTELATKKAIEVGNIFKQRTKFTGAFEFTYKDADGTEQPVEMAAYGIGLSRVMGTIVEIYHDERGIIWPEAIAPYQIHLVSLCREDSERVAVEDIYNQLAATGIEVLFDDRELSAGEKFADSDLIGIPKRVIVSAKTLAQNGVEVKDRATGEVTMVEISNLLKTLKK
jgi:prolyl-tRNA synthetase